jgi:hypothetical protein
LSLSPSLSTIVSGWASQRAILCEAGRNGEKTPQGWALARLFEILEELELASKLESC